MHVPEDAERPVSVSTNMLEYFVSGRLGDGHADKRALVCGDLELTYAQVHSLALRYARAFERLGVQPEQRVMIALSDGPDYVAALFGILAVGAVVVMVNPGLGEEELRYLFEYTRARAVLVDAPQQQRFAEAAEGMRRSPMVLPVAPPLERDAPPPWVDDSAGDFVPFASHPDDAAIWLFSGGTTGRPKAVIQTHRSFIHSTRRYAHGVLGIGPEDVTLSVPKLYFGYATGGNLLFPFSVGATAILDPERTTAERLFDLIERHRPTILLNVPTMALKMVDHPDASRRDLSSLRLSISAGEALSEALYSCWKARFGVELLDGLGTAEMWHIFISNRPGDVRPGTMGRVVEGFEVKVCDDEGREVAPGEVGWLRVRGGSRAIGYWQQQRKTEEAFLGPWYVSGDMVSRDAEGYFTYCGRGDDMLKVSGKWLSPKEVEDCLMEHPSVRDCAVVGVADGNGLVHAHAFVVPAKSDGAGELEQLLVQFVRARLQPYKAPRHIHLVDALPQTHLGKVARGKLKAMAARGGAR